MKGAVYVAAALVAAALILALAYLIGRAARRARARARTAADQRARARARWVVISEPYDGGTRVVIELVARVRDIPEVLDRVVLTYVETDDPTWELDVAVQDARSRAEQLNTVREEAHRG